MRSHKNRETMNIAGVRYLIHDGDIVWTKEVERGHRLFMTSEHERDSGTNIEVRFLKTPPPCTGQMELIFDNNNALRMFRYGSDYCLVNQPQSCTDPVWTALFDEHAGNVRVHLGKESENHICPALSHPLDEILLTFALSSGKGALIHGGGFGIDGKGILITGHSGAGKSTLSRLLQCFESMIPLSDERIAVRNMESEVRIFGTPWHSDAGITGNADFPLSAVFFLKHGHSNEITPCPQQKALNKLLPLTFIPWYDPNKIPQFIDFCGFLTERVPFFDYSFYPDEKAAETLIRFTASL